MAQSVEELVCGDAALASLDVKLATAYAKGFAPTSEWTERDRKASHADQRAWIAERNACAERKDARECVSSAYQRRRVTLQIKNGELSAPKPVGYRCEGLASQPVTAAYYEQTEPPSTVISVGTDRQVVAFASPTASGVKYVAKGVELWEHRGDATLTWSGSTYPCKPLTRTR